MENNFENHKLPDSKLINQSFITELLNSIIEGFFFEEDNKKKIGYIYLNGSPKAKALEEKISSIEELVISIRENLNHGNYKRSLHLVLLLEKMTKEASKQLEAFFRKGC
jgi:hypothetical protein